MTKLDYDVIVFGAGMVGAAAALGLARQGMQVAIIEPELPEMTFSACPDMRVSAISLASEQLLSELGAWQRMDMPRLNKYNKLSVWEDSASMTSFDADLIGQQHLGHILENRQIQIALQKQLQGMDNVTWYDSGDLLDAETGKVAIHDDLHVSSRLILIAEGGLSKTREKLGIGTTGWQYEQQVLAISVELPKDSGHHTWQQFTPSGPKGFLPLFGPFASLVCYGNRDELQSLSALSEAPLKAKLRELFVGLPDDFKINEQARFPITRMHAQRYGRGRALLVGDAAHTINPLAGQGVNLGFKDVQCLLQILKEHPDLLSNTAQLLTRYERSRRTDNLLMMSAMDGFYALFSNDNPALKFIRNNALALANKQSFAKQQVLKYATGLSSLF